MIEALLALAALVVAVGIVLGTGRSARGGIAVATLLVVAFFAAVAAGARSSSAGSTAPRERPSARPSSDYVSSAACLPCHAKEHASFGRTFHRTMTADATPTTVLALRAGYTYPVEGRTIRLETRGAEVWATLPDPSAVFATAPEVTRRVVLTTGSHREQTYWVKGQREGELRLVPIVYLLDEARVIPRHDAFLTPPDEPLGPARWNSNCIACHAVAGEPGHDEKRDVFDTRVAELGIACEACHGPGRAHVEKHQDPLERYAARTARERAPDAARDATIVQPRRLPPERSAAVCGQCHSYAFPKNEDAFWTTGYTASFRPGDTLLASRTLLARGAPDQPELDREPDTLFWPDGTIRVGGREYNGLVRSPCWVRGEGARKMTCLSCHSMHEGDPDGQLAPAARGDAACTQSTCHAGVRPHSHHVANGPGDSCIGCHMPKTSYALFHGVRSHTITTPDVARTLRTGEPTACSLCHLDRTLAWTAAAIAGFTGRPAVTVPEPRASVAEGAWLALRGDAAMRVLVAAALGTKDAHAAGVRTTTALLPELSADPYAAVRIVAARSAVAAAALEAAGPVLDMDSSMRDALLLVRPGVPDEERRAAHRRERDTRRITIAE